MLAIVRFGNGVGVKRCQLAFVRIQESVTYTFCDGRYHEGDLEEFNVACIQLNAESLSKKICQAVYRRDIEALRSNMQYMTESEASVKRVQHPDIA